MTHAVRSCTVYASRGESHTSFEAPPLATRTTRERTVADQVPVSDVMSRVLICARADLEVAAVIRLIVQHHVGCLPVVDERRRPIGMITKFDVVEQLDVLMQSHGKASPLPSDLAAKQAEELMMPIALVLDEHATIAHAAAMMSLEDTHHVLVVRETGELVGVVSSKDIVKWVVSNDNLVGAAHRTTSSPWRPLYADDQRR